MRGARGPVAIGRLTRMSFKKQTSHPSSTYGVRYTRIVDQSQLRPSSIIWRVFVNPRLRAALEIILDIDDRVGLFDREADEGGYRSQDLADALDTIRQEIGADPGA